MKARSILIFSTVMAILTLTVGSLIFWTYFFYPNHKLEEYGFLTILIATPLCIAGLILTIIFRLKNKNDQAARKKAAWTIGLILINIPFCVFYVLFACYLMDTERITIINNTDSDVVDIHVFGAGSNNGIEKIEKGDSKTVWVHMTQEGSIKMTYWENGHIKEKWLCGYTGPSMGVHRLIRHINWAEEDIN